MLTILGYISGKVVWRPETEKYNIRNIVIILQQSLTDNWELEKMLSESSIVDSALL